ncbi:MAG TPA: hypothetical protein VGP80_00555 [Gemmatimonadales bacterium]|nr:hypothetical protein [Gemmatimonadales bacterium]
MVRKLIVLIVILAACEQRKVEVRASLPGLDGVEAPVAHLAFVVLPYDRDSILALLEKAAPTPRPHTRQLDSLFALWRGPFTRYASASYRAQVFSESLAVLRSRLDSLPRNAPNYAALYGTFGALTDSLAAARLQGDAPRQDLERLRRRVIPVVDSLRRDVTAWENSTFRSYESMVGELTTTRDALADTTGADGRASLHLKDGPWWVYAWTWDAGDPYRQWYWNVPVRGKTVELDARSGRRRPSY